MNNEFANPEKYFKEFSSRILTFIANYRSEVLGHIYSDDRFNKEDEKFFFTIVLKTLNTFETANIFIRNFDSSRDFQISLYILIRAILNDILIAEYVIVQPENDEERIKLINQINFDHLKHIISTLKVEKEARKLTESEYQKEIRDLKNSFEKYFNEDGTDKIIPLRTSVQNLVKSMLEKSNDERSHKLISAAYILYNSFSKLEHYGELSFALVNIVYHDSKQQRLTNELFNSVKVIVAALNNYCKLWDDLKINYEKLNNLEIEILKMLPNQNGH
ncbi:hypothetical protein [Flavobacterium marginilacus]|uniref:hypothetical protein n=1 Tax=Flavobacterium marginilacus TaxID=3003256 RepID=UPI00248E8E85|nr:hypothetical protein [Flavobacterium marginilacus]